MTPDLATLLQDPQRVAEIPPEDLPALLGELERLKAVLWARMMSAQINGSGQGEGPVKDRLLTVKEAAARLKTSTDFLYRNANALPFTVRLGSRLRFSARGLARYIRQRQGR